MNKRSRLNAKYYPCKEVQFEGENFEWDTAELAQLGFAKDLVNHNIRKIHFEGVMAHLIRGLYIIFFEPMMKEAGWRSYLQ